MKAQSKTERCFSWIPVAPSIVSFLSMEARIDSTVGSSYPSVRSASGTVWLTILSIPPPASCLYFTRAMSGSMPVVSQSIRKLIVPVGARTVA